MAHWHENDSFWQATAPAMFTPERIKQAAGEVDQITKLLDLVPGQAVLDMGCGPGRHSVEFAKRGFKVTGVDRTEFYLEQARKRADEVGAKVEWIHGDMRSFRRENAFAAAVSVLTSFGYFDDEADDRRAVTSLFAALKPGGRLLIDLMGREVLARIFRERDWREEAGGLIVLEERKLRDDWRWLDLRWILLTGEKRTEHRFRLRLFSAGELAALLRDAGFQDIRCYGSLAGDPYDQNAQRLVTVGHKSKT